MLHGEGAPHRRKQASARGTTSRNGSQSGGPLGFQRTPRSNGTGDSHQARPGEGPTQRLQDLRPTGLPLLGGHLKSWMASAHLLRRDKSESHDTGPPPLSAPLCSAARALSPRPPFCTRHVPPTVMLQGQPEWRSGPAPHTCLARGPWPPPTRPTLTSLLTHPDIKGQRVQTSTALYPAVSQA